ncbi:hypothetical protein [Pseudonocardia adelaidensis]|uniref:Uncharacterized protein n=1 Tax=Pseudonocardia adelaidensis TaxID=648754 RepID=A0ABP9NV65_9PSEU
MTAEHSLLVFPVGHYVGERHPEEHHVVRVGLTHQRLTADGFGVWVIAHGSEEIGKGLWTLEAVFDLAEAAGLSGVPDLVATMIESGLLVTVAADRDAACRFAATYRLNPMLVGLGNTDREPDCYQLGLPGLPVAVLDRTAYELWQWSRVAPSLWHTCMVREKVLAGLGERVAAADLVEGLLGDLRELLASGCAFLDLAEQR